MSTARIDRCSLTLLIGAAAVVLLTAGCGSSSERNTAADASPAAYEPVIDPASFTDAIDNRFLPLRPGTRWVYASSDGTERIEVEVTAQTRRVMGVDCVVVSDTAFEDGQIVEKTLDWFAQDADGAVWYFGEETAEFDNGVQTSTTGSWEAGVDGAQPGIVMPAEPAAGAPYQQEYSAGEAEDMGQVLRIGDSITVPAGAYENVVVTRDWTPLEPDVEENKYYASGVGVVAEVKVKGGNGRVELVELSLP